MAGTRPRFQKPRRLPGSCRGNHRRSSAVFLGRGRAAEIRRASWQPAYARQICWPRRNRGHGRQALVRTVEAGYLPASDDPGLESPYFCWPPLGLPSTYFLCIIEYALSNREAQWRVLKAKTNEMRSSTPRRAYLRSAVLPLPQRQRYQNKLASPRELCLRTSRLKMI